MNRALKKRNCALWAKSMKFGTQICIKLCFYKNDQKLVPVTVENLKIKNHGKSVPCQQFWALDQTLQGVTMLLMFLTSSSELKFELLLGISEMKI